MSKLKFIICFGVFWGISLKLQCQFFLFRVSSTIVLYYGLICKICFRGWETVNVKPMMYNGNDREIDILAKDTQLQL